MRLTYGMSGDDKCIEEKNTAGEVGKEVGWVGKPPWEGCLNKDPRIWGMRCVGRPFPASVQFSCSVMSNCLRPYEPQHISPPCPLSTARVYANPCALSWWCHSTISSSVVPFSSHPQSFPVSGSFLVSVLFASSGQSIGVSASTSVLPVNTQDWSPVEWTDWISLQSLTTVFFNTIVQKHQFFSAQFSL